MFKSGEQYEVKLSVVLDLLYQARGLAEHYLLKQPDGLYALAVREWLRRVDDIAPLEHEHIALSLDGDRVIEDGEE